MTVILELGTKQHQYCPSVTLRYSSNLKHSTIINVLRSIMFFLKSQIDAEKKSTGNYTERVAAYFTISL